MERTGDLAPGKSPINVSQTLRCYGVDKTDSMLSWWVFQLVIGTSSFLISAPVLGRFDDSPPIWVVPIIMLNLIGSGIFIFAMLAILLHILIDAVDRLLSNHTPTPRVEPRWLDSARIRWRSRGGVSFWAAATLLLCWRVCVTCCDRAVAIDLGIGRDAVDQAGALLGWAGNVTLIFWLITLGFSFMYRRRLNTWRPDPQAAFD